MTKKETQERERMTEENGFWGSKWEKAWEEKRRRKERILREQDIFWAKEDERRDKEKSGKGKRTKTFCRKRWGERRDCRRERATKSLVKKRKPLVGGESLRARERTQKKKSIAKDG